MKDEFAWCPCCQTVVPILPEPAAGNCAICYNHTMKPTAWVDGKAIFNYPGINDRN